MERETVPEDMRDKVIAAVSPGLDTHSVWRDSAGTWYTQCNKLAVYSNGQILTGWKISYPGHPEGTSWDCRKCKQAM